MRVITVERLEPAAPGPAAVTAADMVAGHVTLDISGPDRLYLRLRCRAADSRRRGLLLPRLRGKPIVSPALFGPIGETSGKVDARNRWFRVPQEGSRPGGHGEAMRRSRGEAVGAKPTTSPPDGLTS
jgi:hypothetical protein